MKKPVLLSMTTCLIALGYAESIAQPDNGKELLERLLNDEKVSLNSSEFPNFVEICLVGWERLGFLPQHIEASCGNLKDHSMVGVSSSGSCIEIISSEISAEFDVNFADDGDVQCVELPSSLRLQIYQGVEGYTFDRLAIGE